MRPGRKPKPTHLKVLEGRPGHRALNEDEPQPDPLTQVTPPPAHLSGEAQAYWREKLPALVANRMISEADMTSFEMMCSVYGDWVDAKSYVAKQGAVLLSPAGFPIQNPYKAIANRAFEQLKAMQVEFGLTPSSRSRVSSTGAKKKANRFLALVDGTGKTKRRA